MYIRALMEKPECTALWDGTEKQWGYDEGTDGLTEAFAGHMMRQTSVFLLAVQGNGRDGI